MELRQIHYFVAIAEAEHFGRASHRLRIAQPALSRQMKLLEAELGVELFQRLPRGVRLTEAGRSFLSRTQMIERQLSEAADAARAAGKGHLGSLQLSFIDAVAWHGLLPDALRRFRAAFPDVKLGLHAMPTAQQLAALHRDETDAALIYNAQSTEELIVIPLAHHPVVLAVPADSPLATRERIAMAELAGQPMIGIPRSASPTFYDEVHARFRELGVTPNIIAELPVETELLALVSAGAGLALSNACQMDRPPRGVRFIPLTDLNVYLRLCLVHKKGKVTATLSRFLEVLASVATLDEGNRFGH